MKTKGIAMAANVLSKKEIDEYIRLHYKPNDEADDKGFFEILKGPRKYLPGRRVFAVPNVTGDTLQYLLDKIRNKVELSFSEKLIELIKEKGKKPADIYKKAEIDKALFSKIKSDKNYHPSKETALAFARAYERCGFFSYGMRRACATTAYNYFCG